MTKNNYFKFTALNDVKVFEKFSFYDSYNFLTVYIVLISQKKVAKSFFTLTYKKINK